MKQHFIRWQGSASPSSYHFDDQAQELRAASVAGDLQWILRVLKAETKADQQKRLHVRNLKAKKQPIIQAENEVRNLKAEIENLERHVLPVEHNALAVLDSKLRRLDDAVQKAGDDYEDLRQQLRVTYTEAVVEKGRLKKQVHNQLLARHAELRTERKVQLGCFTSLQENLRTLNASLAAAKDKMQALIGQRNSSSQAIEQLDKVPRSINQTDELGRTAAMLAIDSNQLAATKLLRDHGARLDLKDANGRNCLMRACMNGAEEIVAWLLSLDIRNSISAYDSYGATPFWVACYGGNAKIVKLMLDAGCRNCGQLDRATSVSRLKARLYKSVPLVMHPMLFRMGQLLCLSRHLVTTCLC